MKVETLNKKVIVEKEPEEDLSKSKAGLFLPDSVQARQKKTVKFGKVAAIGSGVDVKVGQRVLYYDNHATMFDGFDDDKNYVMLRSEDLIGIEVTE